MPRGLFIVGLMLLSPFFGLAAPVVQHLDEALLDPAYPDMRQWAAAGVQIEATAQDTRPIVRVRSGEELAAAVAVPNRIVLLGAETYRVATTLRFADQVVLRGTSPFQTKLILTLRGERPTVSEAASTPWTTGLLLENCRASGIENLTVQFGENLLPPPDPRQGARSYQDNPDGQNDLHVVAVRFSGSTQCWLSNVSIRNSGQHPLLLESSQHLTIDGVEIQGAYNKGPASGQLLIRGSESCLLSNLNVSEITHVTFGNSPQGHPSRYNVLINSRLMVDVRFQDPATSENLIQECVIDVPLWHDFPPIALGWNSTHSAQANTTNLIYLCTITRDFSATRSRFSIAANPNLVYHVLANSSLKGNVEEHGPAPMGSTLRPAR